MSRRLILAGLLLAGAAIGQQPVGKSQPGWPCVGGRAVDPSYIQVAEATGGQVFMFDRSEAGRSLVLMRESQKHEEVVSRAMGTLAAGYRDFEIPVDTTIESLLFAISLQCVQAVTIYRPSGGELRASDAGVDNNQYRAGRIVVMARPEPGNWRVRIAGAGLYFAVVQAKSDIALDAARFVELGGRPGHEGYFPINTRLRLISSSGETLQSIDLESPVSSGGPLEYMTSVTPTQPAFRIVVEGRDASGFPYQRVHPKLIKAQREPAQ